MNPAYQNVRFHADLPKAGVPSRFANEASLLRLVTALICGIPPRRRSHRPRRRTDPARPP